MHRHARLYYGMLRGFGLRRRSEYHADAGAVDAADTRANVATLALADLFASGRPEHTPGKRQLYEL